MNTETPKRYQQLTYEPTTNKHKMITIDNHSGCKAQGTITSKIVQSNGELPRHALSSTTGFVGYKARQYIGNKLHLPIQAQVKKSLIQGKVNEIYTPQHNKFDGYVQHPRPLVKPYSNQINPHLVVAQNQMKPKQAKSMSTMRKLTNYNPEVQSRQVKIYGELLTGTMAEQNRIQMIKSHRIGESNQSRKQIVFDKVNEKVGDMINGMPNEVNLQMMIKEDPYTNDTSKLLKERYSSLASKNKSKVPRNWSDIKINGVSGRFVQGTNPNSMSSFNYVDSLSTNNERMLKMRANLIDNREGFINGRGTSMPGQKLLDKIKVHTSVVPSKKHAHVHSINEKDFKNHMRDALSSFKISKNENERSIQAFETKSKSLAPAESKSNRESLDNSSFYQKSNMYGYQGLKNKYNQSASTSATALKKITSKFDDPVPSTSKASIFDINQQTLGTDGSPRNAGTYQPKFSTDKIVRNFMHKNISLKKMLKDRRFVREGKGQEKVAEPPAAKSKEDKKGKGKGKEPKEDKKGKGTPKKEDEEEESVKVTEPEKLPTPEHTDDEEDSVIDDIQEPDYTHTEQYYRRKHHQLVPDSILSAQKTQKQQKEVFTDIELKKKEIPSEASLQPKAYRAHTKGKFEDCVAVPNADQYLIDKKWAATANPASHALEKHFISRDKYLLEKRRFQKIVQQVQAEEAIGIRVTRIPDEYKHKITSKVEIK